MEINPNNAIDSVLTFAEVAKPGAIISNAWPQARAEEGGTLRAIEAVLTHYPLFEAIQTLDVPYPAERRAIARLLEGKRIPHTYTLTRLLAEKNLSLSSLDPAIRQRAVELVRACFEQAQETGAPVVALISGARPADPGQRTAALTAFEDSLEQLADAATAYAGLELVVEPLDYEAHKRATLGSTAEAVDMCRRIATKHLRVGLCLDTSHLILNGEDSVAAVGLAREFLSEFHFCNPVLDRTSSLYGDQHPPFGAPGVVDIPEVAIILAGLRRTGYLAPDHRPRVFAEVMKPAHLDSLGVIAHCQSVLLSGWARAQTLLAAA